MINKRAETNAIYDLQDVEWMGREIRVYEADKRYRSPMRIRRYDNKKN